ncbi:Ran-binding and NUP50 nuclear pore complex domain-containing protein [Paramicrosporidium saccamoebae]|uniref:Ran-binding and NUP50 nuclear pore complex domain-containing protein n=1 Tax=Paramicrosporidium saccamoebae TaxID=1246581 RepID=A0A2H9TN80_9FUNG|nr:Ran-binding and NUP50 nuclear pore complex domain-containing protein [Paramicrosporidium saccamoebae]
MAVKSNPFAVLQEKPDYELQLRGLNHSFGESLRKRLESDPTADLTTLWKQYEKHLESIKIKCGKMEKPVPNVGSGLSAAPAIASGGFTFPASEAVKPVTAAEPSVPFASMAAVTKESLGAAKSETTASNAVETSKPAGFSFGSTAVGPTGFSFGAKPTESSSFSFGAKPTESTDFSFGAKPTESTGFSFGAKPTESTSFSFGAKSTESSSFSFGTKPAESSGFSFGAQPTESDKSPFVDTKNTETTPLAEPISSSAKPTGSSDAKPTELFSFGVKPTEAASFGVPSTTSFSFGAKPTETFDKPATTASGTTQFSFSTPFSFNANAQPFEPKTEDVKPFQFSFGAPQPSFGTPAQQTVDLTGDDEGIPSGEEESFTNVRTNMDLITTGAGEEDEETLAAERCKLFAFSGGWTDLGVCIFKINKRSDGRSRVLARVEGSGKILLNSWIEKSVQVEWIEGKKEFSLICVSQDGKPAKYLVRCKEADLAKKLSEELKSLI